MASSLLEPTSSSFLPECGIRISSSGAPNTRELFDWFSCFSLFDFASKFLDVLFSLVMVIGYITLVYWMAEFETIDVRECSRFLSPPPLEATFELLG